MNTRQINKAFEYAQIHGGVTFNETELYPTTGFMVSFPDMEVRLNINEFTIEKLTEFCQDNDSILLSVENSFVGVWLNEEDNMYYLDISEQISSKEHALRIGMLRDQLAIYDCQNQEVINLPSRQKTGTEYQKKSYINQVVWGFL